MSLLLATPAWVALLQINFNFGTTEKIMLGSAVGCLLLLIFVVRSTFGAPVTVSTMSRLQNYVDREENLSPLQRVLERAEADEAARTGRRRRDRSADLLPTVSGWINNSRIKLMNNLSADLTRIGSNWRASEILYVGLFGAMLMFFLIGIVLRNVTWGIIVAAIVLYVPFFMVRYAARRWMSKFENQLADTLLLMSNATQAGYGFQQAMEMVAREGAPPMNEEFAKVNQEIRLGVPVAEALQHMGERIQNADLNLTITAIQISMEVGAALSEILRTISETIRERVRIRGEISALTAQGRLTGLILTALPLFMFLILSVAIPKDPQEGGYIDPLLNKSGDYPMGPKLIVVGFLLQAMGFYVINRIVNIDI